MTCSTGHNSGRHSIAAGNSKITVICRQSGLCKIYLARAYIVESIAITDISCRITCLNAECEISFRCKFINIVSVVEFLIGTKHRIFNERERWIYNKRWCVYVLAEIKDSKHVITFFCIFRSQTCIGDNRFCNIYQCLIKEYTLTVISWFIFHLNVKALISIPI